MISSKILQLVLIVSLTLLAYLNIFGNEFVWDDQFFILEWDKIRNWENLGELLKGELPPRFQGAFRPLLGVFYLLFYQIFETNPLGWHIQSIVVHILNTVVVYLVVAKLVKDKRFLIPLICALIFGVHPIHTEAVTYISASINSIGYLFLLLSLYFYILSKDKLVSKKLTYYLISVVFAALAFFTYEFTLTLPLLIILYELCLNRKNYNLKILVSKLKSLLPYFLLVGVYLVARIFLTHTVGRGEYLLGSLSLTMLTMSKVLIKYLELMVWPVKQTVFHTLPGGILTNVYINLRPEAIFKQSLFEGVVILSLAILLISLILAFKLIKKEPLISFAIFFFYISLLPASNIIPVQELMAERYLYLPSVGFILLLVLLSSYLSKITTLRYPFLIASVLVITWFIFLTLQRNRVWVSNLTLWEDTIKKSPLSEIAYYNLGNAYLKKDQLDKAITAYKKAIENKADSMGSYINLGTIYLKLAQFDLAKEAFETALKIDPNSPLNHNNLGVLYFETGKEQKALEYFLIALMIDKNYQQARDNVNQLLKRNPNLDIQATIKKILVR